MRSLPLILFLLLGWGFACGGEDARSQQADAWAGDGVAPPDGDLSADAPPRTFARQGGLVTVSQQVAAAASMGAGFYTIDAGGAGCNLREEGPCWVTTCTAASTMATAVSAGVVTASGDTTSITSTPDGTAAYPIAMAGAGTTIPPGTAITVSAAGGTVPAFSTHVVMPAPVTLTTPASGSSVQVDRTMPFAVAWTAGTGYVYLYLQDGGAPLAFPLNDGAIIRCIVPSADGGLTIPPSVLADLTAGQGYMAVTGIDWESVVAGGFSIEVRVAHYASAPQSVTVL